MLRFGSLFTILSLALAACADDPAVEGPDAGDTTPDGDTTPTPTTFTVHVDNVAPWTVLKNGVPTTKVGGGGGALGPGEAYDVTLTAGKGQAFSFASMLGESNDWFFGPGPAGIPLYDGDGNPVSGDVTAQVQLWNAGTEIDQEPGVGADVGPNQSAPDAGAADPDPTVRAIPVTTTLSDGSSFTRPAIADMIRVTVTPGANRAFTIRIENVSTATTLVTSQGTRSVHLSPPAWALHIKPAPLFDEGQPDRGQGLELIAESGRAGTLTTVLGALAGYATPISPGVWTVHRGREPLFAVGVADPGRGLEHQAEDGNPTSLAETMTSALGSDIIDTGVFDTVVGGTDPGPAFAGHGYEVEVTAVPGDHLSFVTMFGMSNDWFFGTGPEGIALFDADGTPIDGDVTSDLAIYDAGTELDQELAVGPDTAPQQAGPDTGAADPIDQVRQVPASRYGVPASAHLRVTVTPQ
ncbi:MAG: spondin domain-containing protein [Kofleriaceae bacterium]|nr:spondin domain-containing protein [Myxococcales bacterium]MCB9561727.1 spondin domain-containing protein [Kofleriaceae bacterium]